MYNKDKTILEILDMLENDIGKESYQVVDHWEADLFAIGIAALENKDQLVYISTYKKNDGEYLVVLEFSGNSSERKWENIHYQDLKEILEKHLKTNI